jgi:YD repeat-containing protein
MKRSILFVLLTLLTNLGLVAQQTNTIIPPSPDAAALGKYGNIPISTYTGIPAINIPLYDVSYRDVNIPISLSYHATGVTIQEDASWVGLGWTLNVGGVITRTVRAGDDMQTCNDGYSNLHMSYQGYPYDPSYYDDADFNKRVCLNEIDPEPDIFYFNFLGKSGSFVFEKGQDPNSNFIVGTPLKAEKIEIKYDKINHKWQVRTADGYSYYFGTVEITETLHGTAQYGQGPEGITWDGITGGFLTYDDIVVSAWYLDKIVTPLGEEVNYSYDSKANNVLTYLYGSARVSINDFKQTILSPDAFGNTNCYVPSEKGSADKTFTFHVYLKEISHPMGKIIFNKSLRDDMMPAMLTYNLPYLNWAPYWMNWSLYGPQKLDNIIFQDNAGATVKRIELVYDYFNAQVTDETKYKFRRLKLDKVRECGGLQDCISYFELFYEESHPLPSKYSNAMDFWGYYNGAHTNISRVPYGTYWDVEQKKYLFVGDADRQPNANFMTAGTLKKITYPTGGTTEFEFEPHDYYFLGEDAFKITDFENNSAIGIGSLIIAESNPLPYETFTFTVTDFHTHLEINSSMTYYLSATTSTPCNVIDPGTYYVGNEPWYSVQNISESAPVITRYMSDFLNYFVSNYNNNCLNPPYTPDAIDPIYRNKQTLALTPGTYEVKIYRRQKFNLEVNVSKFELPDRTIQINSQGVYAKTAGGLRIKRIISKENPLATPKIKRYDYTSPLQNGRISSGRLLLSPNYHVPFYCTLNSTAFTGAPSSAPISIHGRSWATSPLGTSGSGGIVGYDKVTELEGENGENGRTEYYYKNAIENPITFDPYIEGFTINHQTSNGLVAEVRHLDKNENIISSENYEYTRQLLKEFSGVAAKHIFTRVATTSGYQTSEYCSSRTMSTMYYTIISDRWVPSKKIEKLYTQNSLNFIKSITDFEYDTQTHLQLKSEQTSSSKGTSIKTVYSYPPDAAWISSAMWQDKFLYNKIVKKEVLRNNNPTNTYKVFYSPQSNTFLPNKEEVAIGTNPLESIKNYTYSPNGNIQTVTSRDGITQIYLWGYKNSYPIALIKNTTLSQVLMAMDNINESNLNQLASESTPSPDYLIKISNLRINLPKALISTYTYTPLIGLKSVTDANNRTIYYEYDSFGRLKFIKDHDGNILKTFDYKYQQPQ